MVARFAERRRSVTNPDPWSALTAAQKMALYHVRQYGFELLFIRHSQKGLAIARCGPRLLTIDRRGSVDAEPQITLRPPY